ncbi:MAG: site-specific DNA-methyltransferase [Candidatus Hydrogenedentes bacterium]|nr:site-specific DNA-methyltransferase [Candidatus Hydrogenedentota bacterium]
MKKNYEDYSREDLIRLVRERDRKPKFGLLWERDEIDHDRSINSDFIALDFVSELSCGQGPYPNLIIEGDNFDALRYLRMTHAGKVKCIYIDPPYNTGNRDFIYNDRFVEKDDLYRHSKWLEFMYRRLDLARELLREDGVIFVSIGEEEYAHVSLLMELVFPGMKVGTFVWRRRSGANDAKGAFLSVDHEYVLCFAGPQFSFAGRPKERVDSNPDNDPRGPWVDGPLTKAHNFKQRPDAFYPLQNPETNRWYACDPDSVWRFASRERLKVGQKIRALPMEVLVEEQRLRWPADERVVTYETVESFMDAVHKGTAPRNLRIYSELGAIKAAVDKGDIPSRVLDAIVPPEFWVGKAIGYGTPRIKRFVSEIKRTEKPLSTWITPASMKKAELEEIDFEGIEVITTGFTSEGTALLAQMIGNKDFPYPKPIALVKALIAQSTGPEDLVVDFFAGSGTTGQAVLELNADEDADADSAASRRFILVSSTEATSDVPDKNVCRDITRARLNATINGYSYKAKEDMKKVEGVGGTYAYLRTRRILTERVFRTIQHDQVWTALQLIHAEEVGEYDPATPIQVIAGSHTVVIYLTKITDRIIGDLKSILRQYGQATIYSWQPALLEHRIADPRVSFAPIPQFLVNRFGAGARK